MSEPKPVIKKFSVDFSWYLLGSIFPMLLGVIKIPVFTRHYSDVDYGYYGLVIATFTYFSMFLFSWIASCIWRFYNQFKKEGRLKSFYTNLFILYLLGIVILSAISLVWWFLAEQSLVKNLILAAFFQLAFNQFILLYMIVLRMEGKAKFYNIFHSLRMAAAFLLLLILAFVFNFKITALMISMAAVDAVLIIFLLLKNPAGIKLNLKLINKLTIREILNYGAVGLITNIGLMLILSSDRYIIALFEEISYVGIYDQVYNIAKISTVAIATVFMHTINPGFVKQIEIDFEHSTSLMAQYIKAFLLVGIPLMAYASLFSKQIAFVMLGPEFREGYYLLPYIFFGTYIFYLAQFYETRIKFANKLKGLTLAVLFTAALNIGLNFITIPTLGYHWAAITTLISYAALFFLYYLQDPSKYFNNISNLMEIIMIVLVLCIQVLADQVLRANFAVNLLGTIMEFILFVTIYYLLFRKKIQALKIPIL